LDLHWRKIQCVPQLMWATTFPLVINNNYLNKQYLQSLRNKISKLHKALLIKELISLLNRLLNSKW
jgi:hypothetical protein